MRVKITGWDERNMVFEGEVQGGGNTPRHGCFIDPFVTCALSYDETIKIIQYFMWKIVEIEDNALQVRPTYCPNSFTIVEEDKA